MNPIQRALTVPEILLTLRAPGAGWLATLISALDEAQRDPEFDARHRQVLTELLNAQSVPAPVVAASRRRSVAFEIELELAANGSAAPRQTGVA
ncbi:MAG TPA: hypothetical protein VFP88_07155 [Rhodanobacteraceae bacterium]|nr:hypothetical protein [Rhodanobacteraceae bacterium]